MGYVHVVPQWFFGFDITMEFLFAIATLLVAVYSFYIHKLSGQRESRLFGYGFLGISLSYFVKAFLTLFVLTELGNGLLGISVEHLSDIGRYAMYSYILFFIIGLLVLSYMTLRTTSRRPFLLILVLAVIPFMQSIDILYTFTIVSSALLLVVSAHYWIEYRKNGNYRTLLVLVAFLLLFSTSVWLSLLPYYKFTFVIGLVLELLAYICILASLYPTIKRIYCQKPRVKARSVLGFLSTLENQDTGFSKSQKREGKTSYVQKKN